MYAGTYVYYAVTVLDSQLASIDRLIVSLCRPAQYRVPLTYPHVGECEGISLTVGQNFGLMPT